MGLFQFLRYLCVDGFASFLPPLNVRFSSLFLRCESECIYEFGCECVCEFGCECVCECERERECEGEGVIECEWGFGIERECVILCD